MVRLRDLPEILRDHLLEMECPEFDGRPWTAGPPLKQRRVAVVSTAGLQLRGAHPFSVGSIEYRVIPAETRAKDVIMSHTSSNFDRTGFQQDINVVFPIDRLKELSEEGLIDSVATFHYSFVGSTPPQRLERTVRHLASLLKEDGVDSAILVPV